MSTTNELALLRALLVNADEYIVKNTLIDVLRDFEDSDYEYLEDAIIGVFAEAFGS